MIVAVLGLESSGRRWVDRMLRETLDLTVWGASVPCFSGARRCLPEPPSSYDVLVVVARDRSCQEQSVAAMGYNAGQPEGAFTPEICLEHIKKVINEAGKAGKRVLFFDYEAAVLYRQTYLDWFFSLLGVESVPVESHGFEDGNVKYFKRSDVEVPSESSAPPESV